MKTRAVELTESQENRTLLAMDFGCILSFPAGFVKIGTDESFYTIGL